MRRQGARVGLALAGGGRLGAIWEIGARCALEETLVGIDFTHMDGDVGISAGGFIAAGLANGMPPRQMCTAFIENEGGDDDLIHPSIFVYPAWDEYAARLKMLPRLVAQAAWRGVWRGRDRAPRARAAHRRVRRRADRGAPIRPVKPV